MPARLRRTPAQTLRDLLCAGAAVALLVGAASSARAQITTIQEAQPIELDEEKPPFFLFGVSVLGGMALYDMQDLNQAIEVINAEIAEQGSFGIKFDSLDNGGSLGARLRAVVADRVVVDAEYERFMASRHVGGVTSESKIETPADVIGGTLGYDLLSSPNLRWGFGIGFAWYSSRAEQVITETLASQDQRELGRIKLEGSTVGPHYEMFFETRFTDRLFVGLSGGYRQAKIKNLDIKGLDEVEPPRSDTAFISVPVAEEDAVDPTIVRLKGGGDSIDWSGLYGRVSMTYYVNAPTF